MNFLNRSVAKYLFLPALLAVFVGCNPKDGVSEFEDAKAAYELRDLKKAENLFAKCLKYAPDNVEALIYLARVNLDLRQLAAAGDCLAKAAPKAAGDLDYELLSAQVAWYAKDYAKAVGIYTKLGNDAKLAPSVRSEALTGVGIVEMTCDNPHIARIAFLRALRLDRRNASAWYHLGVLYRENFGYLEAALEQFEIYVRLNVTADSRVQNVQRNVIPELKDAIAREAMNRPGASKRDSAACATAMAKADAAWKKGLFKNARQFYQDALKADPLSYPAALGLAKAWEKTDATPAGRQRTFDYYQQACALSPSAVTTFLTAGAKASALGQHVRAVEIYSRAVAASPTSVAALDGLIASLRRVGNKNKIAQAYQLYRETLSALKKK